TDHDVLPHFNLSTLDTATPHSRQVWYAAGRCSGLAETPMSPAICQQCDRRRDLPALCGALQVDVLVSQGNPWRPQSASNAIVGGICPRCGSSIYNRITRAPARAWW